MAKSNRTSPKKIKVKPRQKSPSAETIAKIKASLAATLASRRGAQRVPFNEELTVEQRQKAFLKAYEEIGTLSGAAKAAHVSSRSHYDWLESDSFGYVARFKAAHEAMVDIAEQELRRRGVEGYDKPIIYQGEITGTFKEKSDACLIFYMKGRRSDVFKEKSEITGKDGAPLSIQIYVPGNDRPEQPSIEAQPVQDGVLLDSGETRDPKDGQSGD